VTQIKDFCFSRPAAAGCQCAVSDAWRRRYSVTVRTYWPTQHH